MRKFRLIKSTTPTVPWSPNLAKLQSMPRMKRPKVGTPKNDPTTDGQVRVKHTTEGPELKIKKEGTWKPLEQEENVDTATKGLIPLYVASVGGKENSEKGENVEKAGPPAPPNPNGDLDAAKEGEDPNLENKTW